MYIKDIVDKYCDKYRIGDDLLKMNCIDYVKSYMDKCNLDKDVKSYVAQLVISYLAKMRNGKIDEILK